MSIAFIFPGQGSQVVGMGIDVAENFSVARELYKKADEILGFSLYEMIKEGPADVLKLTVNTQPAVVVTSIALLEVLKEKGINCQATAGHSVGEFAALYCAGVLSLEDCLILTRARGEYMHEAGEKYPGTLAAVIGLESLKLEDICKEASNKKGIVVVANLNCPGQVVISGDLAAVELAGEMAKEAGAKKVIPLAVSAAFHSPLMKEAAEKLSLKLDRVTFNDAEIPFYTNVTGGIVKSGADIRQLMKSQITSQVLWEKSIGNMISDGVDKFIEIGPGKALAGMLKRINRKLDVMNFESMRTYEKTLNKIGKIELV